MHATHALSVVALFDQETSKVRVVEVLSFFKKKLIRSTWQSGYKSTVCVYFLFNFCKPAMTLRSSARVCF